MRRANEIKSAGQWDEAVALDRVVLDADDRWRRRVVLIGERGTTFLLDLPHARALRDGDGIVLDDGSIVRVAGRAEPLIELEAAAPQDFVRLAWHLGNRHADVEIIGDRLRIRRDHVLEDMAARLGATPTPVTAPFNPENTGGPHHGHHHVDDPVDHGHDP